MTINQRINNAKLLFAQILDDPDTSALLKLPQGQYDIPLMIAAKQFQANGKLVSPENELVSLYGDVITVNAQPWPCKLVPPSME